MLEAEALMCLMVAWLLLCAMVGAALGQRIGNPGGGGVLGLLGGPVGWCAVLLLAMAERRQAAEAPGGPAVMEERDAGTPGWLKRLREQNERALSEAAAERARLEEELEFERWRAMERKDASREPSA